jgi:hypothetical protein
MQTKASVIANSSTFSGFAANWKYLSDKNSGDCYYKTLDMVAYLINRGMKFDIKNTLFDLQHLKEK